MIAEAFELDLEDFFDGPLADGPTDLDSQGFDGVEVEVEPRSFIAVSTPSDDFSPAICKVADLGQILRLTLGERHRVSILALAI